MIRVCIPVIFHATGCFFGRFLSEPVGDEAQGHVRPGRDTGRRIDIPVPDPAGFPVPLYLFPAALHPGKRELVRSGISLIKQRESFRSGQELTDLFRLILA